MRHRMIVGIALIATMALAACSSSGSKTYVPPTGPPVKTLNISASNFAFNPKTPTSPAGVIQIDLTSTDGLHDLVIEGLPGFQIEVTSGNSSSGKVELAKGRYTFYCDLPGHRSSGMEGTLTVT